MTSEDRLSREPSYRDPGTIHVLASGFALCQFQLTIPRYWPEGHAFVGINDHAHYDKVTCQFCKNILSEILLS